MRNMVKDTLRKKTVSELMEEEKKVSKDIEKVASEITKGKEKNVKKLGQLRRLRAKVLTVLQEKRFMERINADE